MTAPAIRIATKPLTPLPLLIGSSVCGACLCFLSPAIAQDDVEELDERPAAVSPAPPAGQPEASAEAEHDHEDEDENDDEPPPPVIPPATDLRTSHLILAAGGHLSGPFGSVESGVDSADIAGWGFGLNAEVSYGVHRNLTLGLWGTWLSLPGDDGCPGCSLSGFAAGAAANYFLAQGLRFDPYASAGLGWRSTEIQGASAVTYSGPTARFQVGGDWFITSQVGFGPYLGLDVSRYVSRSDSETPAGALDWQANFGLRLVFDPSGR